MTDSPTEHEVDLGSFPYPVVDHDSGVRYEPWFGHGNEMGFRCVHPDGRVRFIYLNPTLGSDDGVPTVFVYEDAIGDPSSGGAVVHIRPDFDAQDPTDVVAETVGHHRAAAMKLGHTDTAADLDALTPDQAARFAAIVNPEARK